MRHLPITALCFLAGTSFAQSKTDNFLRELLLMNQDKTFTQVLQAPKTYRLQIIYTQINRDSRNTPSFKNYYYNYDPQLYFNPASTVKLPLAALALEKLNKINVAGVNKYTTIQFDSSFAGQNIRYTDSSSENKLPSIAHFIKKAFLVSDNDAYNRFYQFIGQQTINHSLKQKGYNDIRITRQFRSNTAEQNRHTNQVRFLKQDGSLLYIQAPAYNMDSFDFSSVTKIGKGYMNRNDSLINEPMDFTTHNNISLEDLQQVLQSVMFPAAVPQKQCFELSADDYTFLWRYLSQFSSETSYPKYDTAKYYDSYVKFFFRNASHQLPAQVRVFNKVGWSYGFLTDVSYVIDLRNKVEYMLAATMYVNSDSILNDDKYDYDSIGYPFMYLLGQTIYQYELGRKRKFKPDLSRFKLTYESRDPNDERPSIKQVEN